MSTHAGEGDQGSSTMAVKIQARGSTYIGELWNDGAYFDVKRILINHGVEGIYTVQIEYIDENGEPIWGAQHGKIEESSLAVAPHLEPNIFLEKDTSFKSFQVAPELIKLSQVNLNYPNEYLISIHGYGNYGINSLTFESNKKTWGPYGKEMGTKFVFPIVGAKIVGFHGSSPRLNTIGVYVQPISKYIHTTHKTNTIPECRTKLVLKPQVPKPQLEHFSLGVYGREEGEYWSQTFVAIKRFVIYHDHGFIISIQMEYVDENGKSVLSKKHGGNGGTLREVVLAYPNERLLTIEGCYEYSLDSNSNTDVIRSLTVITNKNTYGPVGVQNGTFFEFPSDRRLKVVGIHGRFDLYLNAIGLYAALI